MGPAPPFRRAGSRMVRGVKVGRREVRRQRKRLRRTAAWSHARRGWERTTKHVLWRPLLALLTRREDPRDRLLRAGPAPEESSMSRVRMKR